MFYRYVLRDDEYPTHDKSYKGKLRVQTDRLTVDHLLPEIFGFKNRTEWNKNKNVIRFYDYT